MAPWDLAIILPWGEEKSRRADAMSGSLALGGLADAPYVAPTSCTLGRDRPEVFVAQAMRRSTGVTQIRDGPTRTSSALNSCLPRVKRSNSARVAAPPRTSGAQRDDWETGCLASYAANVNRAIEPI
jgi:hypothetical protein